MRIDDPAKRGKPGIRGQARDEVLSQPPQSLLTIMRGRKSGQWATMDGLIGTIGRTFEPLSNQ